MEWLELEDCVLVGVERNPQKAKGMFSATSKEMLVGEEGIHWLNQKKWQGKGVPPSLEEVLQRKKQIVAVNTTYQSLEAWKTELERKKENSFQKKRVHVLALGDVGSTVLMGLKLLGKDSISEIGICDMNDAVCKRWESEMNQTAFPWAYDCLPEVYIVEQENLFDCDVFVFCASKGIPPVGAEVKDVRMVQFEANREIVGNFAKKAREQNFKGLFAVVSDPVDPLCKAAFLESNKDERGTFDGKGLRPEQIQGYGLGVMNARAAYFAKKDSQFASFLEEGRAYGPHGQDLVIANSIANYDDKISKALTKLTIEANLQTRALGFKPYIAPALSSAAISIVLTIEGKWHYSSNFLGGVYMGCKNRTTPYGLEVETLPLPEALYERIVTAFQNLEEIL